MGRKGHPWFMDVNTSRLDTSVLRAGATIPGGLSHLEGHVKDRRRCEDFPMTSDSSFVVSTAARLVIERVAPGNCEFLPIPVICRGETLPDPYWVMNVLSKIECIDEMRSEPWKIDTDGRFHVRIEIDPTRVPSDTKVFRAVDHGSVFIREEMRQAFEESKLSGWAVSRG